MAQVPKPNQNTDLTSLVPDPKISDISVARLIDDGLLVLYREIKNLLRLSTRGKLEANDARDLRDHLKLLFELKDRESESLRGLTDAQLEEKVKEALANATK
jgi:hypothetical protein